MMHGRLIVQEGPCLAKLSGAFGWLGRNEKDRWDFLLLFFVRKIRGKGFIKI
jgi:hypothetical protein